jgi:hypothetical protein
MDNYPDWFLDAIKAISVLGAIVAFITILVFAIYPVAADTRIYDKHEQYIGRIDRDGQVFDRHEGYRGRLEGGCND